MNLKPDPQLTAVVIPLSTVVPPSARSEWVRFLLAGCGVDVEGIEQILAESRQAERAAIQAEIEATDKEALALAERRAALLEQLRGGGRALSNPDRGDVFDSAIRRLDQQSEVRR